MEKARVQKWIANSGCCSRRKAEELIENGLVKVNGKLAQLGDQCLQTDKIEVSGKSIKVEQKQIYIILNKPKGFVCSKDDPYNPQTVYELIDEQDGKNLVKTVGRLDKHTTGLLILTNDGDFSQKIIHPSSSIVKEYLAHLDTNLSEIDKKTIERGVQVDGYKLSPCKIWNLKANSYVVKINEGRKRQVRKMFEARDLKVMDLKRTKIGGLDLKDLNIPLGKYKVVSKEELMKIFSS